MSPLNGMFTPQRYFTKSSWPFERSSPFGGGDAASGQLSCNQLAMEMPFRGGGSTLVDCGTVLRPSREPDRRG